MSCVKETLVVWEDAIMREDLDIGRRLKEEQGLCSMQDCIDQSDNYKNCIYDNIKLNVHMRL
jgi:hypothetical protein